MQRKPPVFIVGSPRSGTTWLYHVLLSSGGFAIYRTEPKIFTYLAPMFGGFRAGAQRERFLQRWLGTEDFLRSGLEAEPLRRKILNECASAGDCQRLLMDAVADAQGAPRWSDCTPDNLLHIAEIKRSFPDALFIHMIRDGRDVALSMAKQAWIRPFPWDRRRNLLPAALYWAWVVGRGCQAGRRLGDGSYLEVHYRDLVQQYEPTLARIAAFLSHGLDPSRIQRAGIGSVSRPNTSFAAKAGSGFQPVDRWKSSCSNNDLTLMERAIGRRLTELGYPLITPPSQLRGSVWDGANWRLYRLNFALRFWLKTRTPLGRWLSATTMLEPGAAGDLEDKTLRPALHLDFVRSCVAGEVLSGDSAFDVAGRP
ncbi:MAG: sulfotransferase [Bryobacteraceae bacterium]|nr:sulfotransferase [Bryobacteraceae bacterium]